MATHSSVPAWRIPGTGEPGGLPFMGSHRVRHDWSDLAAAAVIQKEVKLYHEGKLLHCKWSGQSEAWDAGNVSWQSGLTMCPLGSDWICSSNSIYWEADLGPSTGLACMGSNAVLKSSKMRVSVCVCMLVAQLCPTFCDPRDNSPPGSSVHGILQARRLGSHSILQGIFLTQGSNLGLLHCGHNQDHCLK